MEESFKNPFEADEEHLEMIELESTKTAQTLAISEPVAIPAVQTPTNSSMFDLLETEHGQEQKQ